ncbi:hypothetical protein [Streptomyces sp. MZ04]|uniref:hypothetical protein n=1 Tax=Streptomyces sp. MZ04 TaxID=2559236 RepID=UPI00107ED09B|nr:hypothetical protein [Streptomyces sp. MZ04]TGB11594.1 hypothetical protein E2651_13015 [Streptomyces sp. MZ04]
MSDYPKIAERFARDTAKHEMTVKREDGLYRHLRFETPAPGRIGPFELITWPYNLVVKAGWTFHFDIDAIEDMFDLFRRTALTGQINPGYWSEEVRAGRDEIKGFEPDLFKGEVASTLAQWMRDDLDDRLVKHAQQLGYTLAEVGAMPDIRRELARQIRPQWRNANRQLREAVEGHFFSDMADYNIEYESEAHRALFDFSYLPEGDESGQPYYFSDWHEWRMKDYTPGFLHSCFAIRHGIDMYDAARSTKAVA